MKKTLFLMWFVFLCGLVLPGVLIAQEFPGGLANVKSGYGSMKVDLVLQALVDVDHNYNKTTGKYDDVFNFGARRGRLILSGFMFTEKLTYLMQMEMINMIPEIKYDPADPNQKALNVAARWVPLLDLKLMFNYIPFTEIAIGRFIPDITNYMWRNTALLDFVHYPLFYSPQSVNPTSFGMWRQLGVQATFKYSLLKFNVGVFDGAKPDEWVDDNTCKDFYGHVSLDFAKFIKPLKAFIIGGYFWYGSPAKTSFLLGGVEFFFQFKNLTLAGEYAWKVNRGAPGSGDDFHSTGGYVQAAFKIIPQLEILGRYDYFDSNLTGKDDIHQWGTVGINWYIKGQNVMLYLDYILKKAQSEAKPDHNILLQVQFFI